jgi:hypothetical protein
MAPTLDLFGRMNLQVPREMQALARTYATRNGLRFERLAERRDLFGELSWRAIFLDSADQEHERTIDDLRVQGPPRHLPVDEGASA